MLGILEIARMLCFSELRFVERGMRTSVWRPDWNFECTGEVKSMSDPMRAWNEKMKMCLATESFLRRQAEMFVDFLGEPLLIVYVMLLPWGSYIIPMVDRVYLVKPDMTMVSVTAVYSSYRTGANTFLMLDGCVCQIWNVFGEECGRFSFKTIHNNISISLSVSDLGTEVASYYLSNGFIQSSFLFWKRCGRHYWPRYCAKSFKQQLLKFNAALCQ